MCLNCIAYFFNKFIFTFWGPSGHIDLSNEVPDRVVAGVLGVRDCIFGIKENYTHMHIIYSQISLIRSPLDLRFYFKLSVVQIVTR